MLNEMIERVAKALWDNEQSQPYVKYGFSNQILFNKKKGETVAWEELLSPDIVPHFANEYREKAKLAIAVMREPPADIDFEKIVYHGEYADDIWREMIDKLLKD